MLWRRIRQWLCRIGIDSACYHDQSEDSEREARMQATLWRFETLVSEVVNQQQQQQKR